MKRPKRSASKVAPDAIAAQAREGVMRWLAEVPLLPRDGFSGRIERLTSTLALWGARINLTANPDDPAEIAFHIVDSLAPIAFARGDDRHALESALGAKASVLDVGSGAGFPGLVLAAAFEAHFTLTESRRKRASYLEAAAHEMDLRNVTIEQRRLAPETVTAEFDLVTGRAVGALADFYRMAASALCSGGLLLVYASAGQPLGEEAARRAGLVGPSTWEYRIAHRERTAIRVAALWRAASSA